MRDDFKVCVPIQSAGEHTLFLTPRHRHFDVVPILYGTTAKEICFLPVWGSSTFKVYARNSEMILRFRPADVEKVELKPYSHVHGLSLLRRHVFDRLWRLPTRQGLKFKLIKIGSHVRFADVATHLHGLKAAEFGPASAYAQRHPEVLSGWPKSPIEPWRPKRTADSGDVAVALHLSDEVVWPEFEGRLRNMPVPFQLYVTSPEPLSAALAQRIVRQFAAAEVIQTGERGGSIGAFFELLYRGAFHRFEVVCKLTDTPAVYSSDRHLNEWRRRAVLIELLQSTARIETVLLILKQSPHIGLLGPANLRRKLGAQTDAAGEAALRQALDDVQRRLGIPDGTISHEFYDGGSFWIRTAALAVLKDLNLSEADFQGQPQAEIAALTAAVELTVCQSVRRSGYTIEDIPDRENANAAPVGRDVLAANWRDVLPLANVRQQRVCLFVSYVPTGRFSLPALYYMRQLKRAGFYVFALAAVPDVTAAIDVPGTDYADAISVRANEGYDFALWAAALRRHPVLFDAKALLLANDSVLGPLRSLEDAFSRIDASDADFIGMTESLVVRRHLQSYFVYFKSTALKSDALRRFWANVRSQSNKLNLIKAYEISMVTKLEAEGLRGAALYPYQDEMGRTLNPTIYQWRELLGFGFPFIKAELLRDNPTGEDLSGWRNLVAANGYDVSIITGFFADRFPHAAALKVE